MRSSVPPGAISGSYPLEPYRVVVARRRGVLTPRLLALTATCAIAAGIVLAYLAIGRAGLASDGASALAGVAGDARVELQGMRFFEANEATPDDDADAAAGRMLHVVAELASVGSAAAASPEATITLYDAAKVAVGTMSCAAPMVRDLEPGERVPCQGSVKAAEWKSYTVDVQLADATARAATLEIAGVETVAPRAPFGAHKVSGQVANRSSFVARNVWVVVGLYDAEGKIVGAGRTLVAGNDLDAGATASFSVNIFNVAGTPARAMTQAFAYR
jgi:hypothetical protein